MFEQQSIGREEDFQLSEPPRLVRSVMRPP